MVVKSKPQSCWHDAWMNCFLKLVAPIGPPLVVSLESFPPEAAAPQRGRGGGYEEPHCVWEGGTHRRDAQPVKAHTCAFPKVLEAT